LGYVPCCNSPGVLTESASFNTLQSRIREKHRQKAESKYEDNKKNVNKFAAGMKRKNENSASNVGTKHKHLNVGMPRAFLRIRQRF
jgi:hypothetical protein